MTYDSSVVSSGSLILSSSSFFFFYLREKTPHCRPCKVKSAEPERWLHNAYPFVFSSLE
jgi:hypothetical protein